MENHYKVIQGLRTHEEGKSRYLIILYDNNSLSTGMVPKSQQLTHSGYGEHFQRLHLRYQPMTDCCGFGILVGADLLPSTGFKMNFLVK